MVVSSAQPQQFAAIHVLLNNSHSFRLKSFSFRSGATSCAAGASASKNTTTVHQKLYVGQSEFSWTKLISDKTRCGQCREALKMYREMREAGVRWSTYTFVAALKACGSLGDLETGKSIHDDVIESGVESHTFVSSSLVSMYARCRSMEDAVQVFERSMLHHHHHHDVGLWNAIILGYVQVQEAELALQLYARMQHEGIAPNARTFVAVLKACGCLGAREKGKQVDGKLVKVGSLSKGKALHSQVAESGLILDTFVANSLVVMYAKCGSMEDARKVFDRMPVRSVVSWAAMILGYAHTKEVDLALRLFGLMQNEGISPNAQTFVGALKACASLATHEQGKEVDGKVLKLGSLQKGKDIQSQVEKSGYTSNLFVATTLVDMYAKCGSMEDAFQVFDRMPLRDVVSWNAMILGYAQTEQGELALQLYARMSEEGSAPNARTFVGALKACASLAAEEEGKEVDGKLVKLGSLKKGKVIDSQAAKGGFHSDLFVANTLVDMYAKCGSMEDARQVFDRMPVRDVVSWNAMILGYAQMEEGELALQLYARMQDEAITPDARTFVGALKACGFLAAQEEGKDIDGKLVKLGSLKKGKGIHSQVAQSGLNIDIFVATTLVDMYAKCGSMEDALKVFERMPVRDVVSWNTMILGYAQMEEGELALHLYAQMQHEGFSPDVGTFVGALKACASVACLEIGKRLHAEICRVGFEGDTVVANSLLDMYGKCGSMGDAQQLFKLLRVRNLLTWNTLITGHSRQGNSEHVFSLFQRMHQEGMQPDGITFLCVLNMCSHMGLINQGWKYFHDMSTNYKISPSIDHYNCMVDLLGRAGQLDEAVALANKMPVQPNMATWRTILAACRKCENVEIAKHAFECAVRLDANHAATYVLMSSIYVAAGMCEESHKLQAMRRNSQAWKKPGESW